MAYVSEELAASNLRIVKKLILYFFDYHEDISKFC